MLIILIIRSGKAEGKGFQAGLQKRRRACTRAEMLLITHSVPQQLLNTHLGDVPAELCSKRGLKPRHQLLVTNN